MKLPLTTPSLYNRLVCPRCRRPIGPELNRRVNEQVGGQRADRQNFTLDQLEEAHAALPELVRLLEEDLRDAAA